MKITFTQKEAYSLLVLSAIIMILGMFVFKLSLEALVKSPIQYIYQTDYFQIADLKTTAIILSTVFSGFCMISAFVIIIKILLAF